MESCFFTKEHLDALSKFFSEGRNCPPDGVSTCKQVYEKENDCMKACEVMSKNGQGFSFLVLMNSINIELNKEYTSCFPHTVFGRGVGGIVVGIACSSDDVTFEFYALKMARIENNPDGSMKAQDQESFHNEVDMQTKFHKHGLAPGVVYHRMYYRNEDVKCGYSLGVILMEKINSLYRHGLESYERIMKGTQDRNVREEQRSKRRRMAEDVKVILNHMEKENLTHGDLHQENIAFVPRRDGPGDRMVLIDFGRSTDFYSNPLLDVSAIAASDDYLREHLNAVTKKFSLEITNRKYKDMYTSLLYGQDVPEAGSDGKFVDRDHQLSEKTKGHLACAVRYQIFTNQMIAHENVLKSIYRERRSDWELPKNSHLPSFADRTELAFRTSPDPEPMDGV